MNEKLFRQKSIDKISSPEQLTDYIKVSNPGVWLILVAIAIFLIGVCVWGIFGKMDTKLPVAVASENGVAVCYVKEADISAVKTGLTVHCNNVDYTIASVSAIPVTVNGAINEYTMHVGDLQNGEWVYSVTLDGAPADGIYYADIITDSVAPMSFVLN